MPKLSPKQLVFCQEYIIDLDGAKAARRAGYSAKTAPAIANTLLKKPQVREKVDELKGARSERTEITSDIILKELLCLARVDLSGAYDKTTGKLLAVHDMPEEVRRAIASIDVFEEYEGAGREREYVCDTKKVKFYDKTRALELLGKHLRLFADKVEVVGNVTGSLVSILQQIPKPEAKEES